MSYSETYIIEAKDLKSVYDKMSAKEKFCLDSISKSVCDSYFYTPDMNTFYAKGLKEQIKNYGIERIRVDITRWSTKEKLYNISEKVFVFIDNEWKEHKHDA